MRYELKSISVWAVVKVIFLLSLVAGFLGGIVMAMFMGVFMTLASGLGQLGGSEAFPVDLSFGALMILLPIGYALGGAFFNTIFGAIPRIMIIKLKATITHTNA